MENECYETPKLVALYDLLNARGADWEYYLDLAGLAEGPILDVGCGTGALTVEAAQCGHMVYGLDPSAAMLDVARRRAGGDRVIWQQGILEGFAPELQFALIYMAGHAFQELGSDAEILAHFKAVRRLLTPEGRFVFDTRNPARRAWLNWAPERSERQLELPGGGRVRVWHNVLDASAGFVSFEEHYAFGGQGAGPEERLMSLSRLRFAALDEITALAKAAGLAVENAYGDWDRREVSDDAPELIVSLRSAPL
ncbi:class I SAM-dependent methyltransferase [Rhodobacteraceae bacterium nBUS_24]